MSEAHDGVNKKKWSKHPMAKSRRYGAMKRLEKQLEVNEKLDKQGHKHVLTDKDKVRITKEIAILKERQ